MEKKLPVAALVATFVALLLMLVVLIGTGCGNSQTSVNTSDNKSSTASGSNNALTSAAAGSGDNLPLDQNPPEKPVRLVFIHHSVGEDWLDDTKGGLGAALKDNHYFVSDTNYGWGPPDADTGSENIGDQTDTGFWYDWFVGPHSQTYLQAVFAESGQNTGAPYARLSVSPSGENEIVMFKSCFPNSALGGNPGDPATTGLNPLRGEGSGSEYQTVANAKGIYNDLLGYFSARQDKLFIAVTAPPLIESETTPEQAANARAFNRWLVEEWLDDYPYHNVAVYDFYDVLTANGGNVSAYGSGDSHPTAAGLEKATAEFVPLLNNYYQAWKGD